MLSTPAGADVWSEKLGAKDLRPALHTVLRVWFLIDFFSPLIIACVGSYRPNVCLRSGVH